jgi:uncharacterized protein YueI
MRTYREIYKNALNTIKQNVENNIHRNIKIQFEDRSEYYKNALVLKNHLEKNGYTNTVYPFTKVLMVYI